MQRADSEPEQSERGGRAEPTKQGIIDKRKLVLYCMIAGVLAIIALVWTLASSATTPVQRCNGILLSTNKVSCFSSLALQQSNVSLCNYLQQPSRDSCIGAVAENESALSTCKLISSSATQLQCIEYIAETSNNASACTNLVEPYRSTCAYSIAADKNFSASSSCAVIGNSSLRNSCDYARIYRTALLGMNASQCNALPSEPNESLVSLLSSAGSGITNSTAQEIALTTLNFSARDYCYYKSAQVEHNTTLCSSISANTIYGNQLCLGAISNFSYTLTIPVNITNKTNQTTLCSSLPSQLYSLCTISTAAYNAVVSRNVSVCLKLSNQTISYSCIATLATTYNDSSFCSYINNTVLKDGCYATINSTKHSG